MPELLVIAPDLLASAICLLLLMLLRENRFVSYFNAGAFARTVVLTLASLVVEMACVYVSASHSSALNFLLELLYTWAYISIPIAVLCMSSLFDDAVRHYGRLLILCGCAYALIVLPNFFFHQLFAITGDAVYSRGPLYPVFIGACFVAGLVFVRANILCAQSDGGYRQWMFFSAVALVAVFTVIEICNPDILVVWPALSMAMLLYYLYLRELQFAMDPLTEVFNRSAFVDKMRSLERSKDVGLVMLDLNRLKEVNDISGHGRGDEYLADAAHLLGESFSGIGTVYRIGGDEFCVICKNASEDHILEALRSLRSAAGELAGQVGYEFGIAAGYALRMDEYEELNAVLARADAAMYRDKEKLRSRFTEK
jgi:diguanylate cyclase (GGDEF)-like protein